jgi:hypothetical protein
MGEQSDPHREMEACRMASMEPATKQANRGGAADAVGQGLPQLGSICTTSHNASTYRFVGTLCHPTGCSI